MAIANKNVQAEVREIEPGEKYELTVTLLPPFGPKRVSVQLKLQTGVVEAPELTLPIYAIVAPRVTALPRYLSVPSERQKPWERTIELIWDEPGTHKILSASVDEPGVSVRVREKDDQQMVVVMVPPNLTFSAGSHALIIKTDDAEMPEVRVPISVRGRAALRQRGSRAKSPLRNTPKSRSAKTTTPPNKKVTKKKTASPSQE